MTDPPLGVKLRPEHPSEVAEVGALVVAAFGQQVVGELVTSLRSSPAWIEELSFVAVANDRIVGQVLLTRALLDAPSRLVDVLVLSPLAVTGEWRGRGIGTALLRHSLETTNSLGEPLVFLEGPPDYYRRRDFEPAGPLDFRRPSLRIPEAAFLVHRNAAYEAWMTGTLVYADPFWRHDCVGLRDDLPPATA